jgi:Fe-S-cluster containining protein
VSLCDVCTRPGRCCVGFELNGGAYGEGMSELELLVLMASTLDHDPAADIVRLGLPYLPFFLRADGHWHFWCPNLSADGRCGDYEHRPWACRSYVPGCDNLCAMHTNLVTQTLHFARIEHHKEGTP